MDGGLDRHRNCIATLFPALQATASKKQVSGTPVTH
jgi:hypothetical protein